MSFDKSYVQQMIEKLSHLYPPENGYHYFFPSPNEGKRLLIQGWLSPSQAAEIAIKIFEGAPIDDFDCVEEID